MTNSKWGNPKTWPKQIKDLRNDLALTHDDLAAEAGIRAERIKNLEKGHKSCSEIEYLSVLDALDILSNPVAPHNIEKSPAFMGIRSRKPLSREEALGVSDKDTKEGKRKTLGKLIRETRKLKSLSKEDFALSLGSNQKQVSKLESAHHSCSMDDMRSALDMLKRFY